MIILAQQAVNLLPVAHPLQTGTLQGQELSMETPIAVHLIVMQASPSLDWPVFARLASIL
jgi:hypothetical protein